MTENGRSTPERRRRKSLASKSKSSKKKAPGSASLSTKGAAAGKEERQPGRQQTRTSRGAKPGKKQRRLARQSKAPFGARSSGRVQALGPMDAAPRGTTEQPNGRRLRETAESLEAAKAAIDAALDKKALLPVLIDVSALASYTDFIGIVSGRSDRQVDAIADGIRAVMKTRGRSLIGQEGTGSGRWTLLDFGDVVIHVFYHPVREFYDLESLWVDAPRVQLQIPPEAVMGQPDALYGNL